MSEDKGHYCLDWDLEFITDKDPGFEACTCFPVRSKDEIETQNKVIEITKKEYGIKS